MTFKKILALTDLTKNSLKVSNCAAELGRTTNGGIEFLHILILPIDLKNFNMEIKNPELRELILERNLMMNDLVKRARDSGLNVRGTIVYDNKDDIFPHLRYHPHDLVVIGENSEDEIIKVQLGSNAQSILRQSLKPVMLVKQGIEDYNF